MNYGQLPHSLGIHECQVQEMFFYQYLPVKMLGEIEITIEPRLNCFDSLIGRIACDFIGTYGLDRYCDSFMYITAKNMYQMPNYSFNREGWHSDGFMTNDINYVWSNNNGFTFNNGDFNLTDDHEISLIQMQKQVDSVYNGRALDNEIYRLDQFVIHKVSEILEPCIRCFVKISFSDSKYNLIGNSHNHLLNYNWEMKPRQTERNHPIAK